MGFTPAEIAYLTSGAAAATLVGEVVWSTPNGLPRGDVSVYATGFPVGSVRFVLNLAAPNKPTFVLTVRGRHCYRLDVNEAHADIPGTHIQQTDDKGVDVAVLDAANMFPPIPRRGTVDGERYRATFLAFSSHLNIETAGLEWTDPPERGA